ncbi:MAG: hypothetical protein AB1486_21945 [Planctomycetota bacterium]
MDEPQYTRKLRYSYGNGRRPRAGAARIADSRNIELGPANPHSV